MININTLKTSTASISNALAGNVAGVMLAKLPDNPETMSLSSGFEEFPRSVPVQVL